MHCFCIKLMRINQLKYFKKLLKADKKSGNCSYTRLVRKWNKMSADEALRTMETVIRERKWVTSVLKEERKAENTHIIKYMADLQDNGIIFESPKYKWERKRLETLEREQFKREWAERNKNYVLAVSLDESQKDEYPMEIWYPPSYYEKTGKWQSVILYDEPWKN